MWEGRTSLFFVLFLLYVCLTKFLKINNPIRFYLRYLRSHTFYGFQLKNRKVEKSKWGTGTPDHGPGPAPFEYQTDWSNDKGIPRALAWGKCQGLTQQGVDWFLDTENELMCQIENEATQLHSRLIEINDYLYENPELGSREFKTAKLLADELEVHGFEVEREACDLETAFIASFTGKEGGPRIAFIAEYDALPEIGHGCGHNMIATIAIGAGIVAKEVLKEYPATIMVIGTPDEEGTGVHADGKILMLAKGAFDDVDISMIVHPSRITTARKSTLALADLHIEFFGKTAHAASQPEQGINALDAMIMTFNSINALRQHVKSDVRIHGIITHGGTAPNIVPEYTAGRFYARSESQAYLREVLEKVKNCAQGAAIATGARVQLSGPPHLPEGVIDENVLINHTLSNIIEENLAKLGIQIDEPDLEKASNDFGNVTQKIPSVQLYYTIGSVDGHYREFAKATTSDKAHQAILNIIKALTMTAVDLVITPDLHEKVKEEFTTYNDA